MIGELEERMKTKVEEESWDTIATLALSFEIELEKENKELQKVKKEMQIIKHILYEHLQNPEDAKKFITTNFFVKLVKTLEKLEKVLKKYEIERSEFLVFLRMLVFKMRKERLIVFKKLERKTEFDSKKPLEEKP